MTRTARERRPVDHDAAGPVLQTMETPLDVVMPRYAAQGPDAPRGRWLTPHLRRLEAEAIEIMREVACECRKPGRGLVDRAARELGVDAAQSFTVGDRWLDVALARNIGGRGILVRTGYGADEENRPPEGLSADATVNNLVEAASWILESLASPKA